MLRHLLTNSFQVEQKQSTDLCTQLEVDHDDADLRAGHHQDDEDQEEEAKQVVELILPDGLQTDTLAEAPLSSRPQGEHPAAPATQHNAAAALTLKMKKSSMNMAPKGKIPAIRILKSKTGKYSIRSRFSFLPPRPSFC